MVELIFHPEASQDVRDIQFHYSQISESLATRFWGELNLILDRIEQNPEQHHFDRSGLRRSNLKKFPYHVLFEITSQCIFILVVRHDKRHPSYGLDRN